MTAVRNEDEQPSVYLDIVDPPEDDDASDELRPFTDVDRAMTLSALVAELRREVVNAATASEREAAARDLARLAAERVPGADPASWWALSAAQRRPPAARPEGSTVSRLAVQGRRLRRLQPALAALRVRRRGAVRGRRQHRHLVHDIAAELGDVDADDDAPRGRGAVGSAGPAAPAGSPTGS